VAEKFDNSLINALYTYIIDAINLYLILLDQEYKNIKFTWIKDFMYIYIYAMLNFMIINLLSSNLKYLRKCKWDTNSTL